MSDPVLARQVELLNDELGPDLEMIRPLGSGRMASVYLARQPALDRLVAVKVLSLDLAGDVIARARFEREARAAAALEHPAALAVYRFGYLDNGVPYLVLQHVAGGTLRDRLTAEGPLTATAARRVLEQVAGALAAAHDRGFVHRDVRPDNVLCEPGSLAGSEGGESTGRVFLADFGLAGLLPRGDGRDPRLTRVGEVIGTPGYWSPEQMRGEPVTAASDVYALGLLGCEILMGRPDPRATVDLSGDPELGQLLDRCLHPDPARRPTASFIAGSLRAVAADPGGASAEGSLLESLLRRRMPQVVVATGVILYSLLSFVGMLTEQGNLPARAFDLALSTFGFGVAASGVVAWFHGARGRQRVRALELLLLGVLGLGWLATTALILLLS